MSDAPVVQTHRNLPRNELDKFFRNNPRIRKAFEDLLLDVGVTLPEAIGNSSEDAASVLPRAIFSRQILPVASSVSSGDQLLAAAAFVRPQPPAQPVNDAAGLILAGQIFGA